MVIRSLILIACALAALALLIATIGALLAIIKVTRAGLNWLGFR